MRNGLLYVLCAVLFYAVTAHAQTASIAGTIKDASNAGVPAATVTAKTNGTASSARRPPTTLEPIRYPISRLEATM